MTPDSFSDGGLHRSFEHAVARATAMAVEGASIVDIGGESTRPGAEPVLEGEELERTIPVIASLTKHGLGAEISIDTSKPGVAEAALAAGATFVNDVSALQASGMIEAVASAGARCCLMHMQGEPRTMQHTPTYKDVVSEVIEFLGARIDAAEAGGIRRSKITVDPGIGFGKTLAHNLELLQRLSEFQVLGCPVLVGVSRKAFIGKLDGADVGSRLPGTIAANTAALLSGASIFRVHDVAENLQALKVAAAIAAAKPAL